MMSVRRSPSPTTTSFRGFQPIDSNIDLQVVVNLTQLLPHQRKHRLINVDPELRHYPVLHLQKPRDLCLTMDDIKSHISEILWQTLTISIVKNNFGLTFHLHKDGKMQSHPVTHDRTIYTTLCCNVSSPEMYFHGSTTVLLMD